MHSTSSSPVEAVADLHKRGNRRSRGAWELYEGHRARLTESLLALAPAHGQGRLVLLGAGNANDVDLESLCARYAAIQLVDLDDDAVAAARERLPAARKPQVTIGPCVDLTGMLADADRWARRALDPEARSELIDEASRQAVAALPLAAADVVASCCTLTQLSWSLAAALGADHPALPRLRAALVATHVRTLAALLRPDGVALLASDLFSSEEYPLDELPPDVDLRLVLARAIEDGRYFAGANPHVLDDVLMNDPVARAAFEPARWLPPWLWRVRPDQLFLVFALILRRAS